MSSATLHFPSAEVMTKFLSNHELLNLDYYQEKGITQTIAKLAAERFANSDKVEMGIKMGTMLIVNDLQQGEDGFTGAKLPKIELPKMSWVQLSMAIESALVDCTKISLDDSKSKG